MLRKKGFFNLITLILILSLSSFSLGCSKKEVNSESLLNIYVDIKDKQSQSIIKFMIDEYKKSKPDIKINISNTLGNDKTLVQDISKGGNADILFTSRNNMLELSKKGLLSDIGEMYDKNKLNERYYKIVASYGRIGDKYYGIGVMPYSIEILYNKNELNRLKIPEPNKPENFYSIIKTLNQNSIHIPIVLTDDISVNSGMASIFANKNVKLSRLEKIYDSSKEEYSKITEMQSIFDSINNFVKYSNINRNTFELGGESTIENFVSGSIPLIICDSYYSTILNSADVNKIGIVNDYSSLTGDEGIVSVIVNSIMCVPANSKNSSEINDFFLYAYSDDLQEKLIDKGFVTGNIKANEKLNGFAKLISNHIEKSDDNCISIIYSLPKKFKSEIELKVDNIISGNYTKKEWQDIVERLIK